MWTFEILLALYFPVSNNSQTQIGIQDLPLSRDQCCPIEVRCQ